jgi:Predicted esterase of the alpha-beta hydrolase superfamily
MSWKCAAFLLTVVALSSASASGQQPPQIQMVSAPSTQSSLPAAEPAPRPVIGLVLEGGGALGLAHIGVLQWIEEHHIPVDRLAGTSMGALVGGLYAEGMTPDELHAVGTSEVFKQVFTLQSPYSDLSFRRRQDRRDIPQSFTLGLRHGVQARSGLVADQGVVELLATNMASYNSHELDFNTMPIPFRCVATDLTTLKAVTFSRGPLPAAVRASISIPGIFPPVKTSDGHYLVDGGILDDLPTDVARNDLHSDRVIAIHLQSDTMLPADTSSIVGVLNRAFAAGIDQNIRLSMPLADLVVSVPLDKFTTTDYAKGAQIIKAGYDAAEQNRAALLQYALKDEDWAAYLAARTARVHPKPGTLQLVQVKGGSAGATRTVVADLEPLNGKPITTAATVAALKPVQSNGGYTAAFETFMPVTAGSSAIRTPGANGDTGILVNLTKDSIGPPYLIVGPEVTATTSNLTRGEINLRVVDQNLGGFGSEARVTGEIGFHTALSLEYYRQLTPKGYFIQPHATVVRQPVYVWANQKRIAERFQQDLSSGLEVGRTFSNSLQISAEWQATYTRWALRTGSGGGPYLAGTAQMGLLHLNIDRAESGSISPSGFRLAASAGALYHAAGSSNAPMAMLSFGRSASLGDKNIFGIGGEIESYLRANVAQPYRFTLGGPMCLSAASIDEYRGTDMYLAHAGYMRRIAALPTGLGQGLYGLLGYEAGEMWSPEQKAFLRQDGTLGLVGNTPLGLVTFGVSIGDAGHRKVFFTVGRWF